MRRFSSAPTSASYIRGALGMESNLFLLKNEKAFAGGTFDNVSYIDGALRLDQSAGRYVQAGCYTSQELAAPAFGALVASWNAATPRGTASEAFVRVWVGGAWSAWMSYGKWSPFLRRASMPVRHEESDNAYLDTDVVRVRAPGGATAFQLRIRLYANDARVTPAVFLLAAAVRPLQWSREKGEAIQRRVIPIPAYSQSIRNPRIGSVICSPTTIAMLMNRWGEDLLPEEVAHANYDYTYKGNGNWSFTAAIAGSYGYECFVAFADIAELKKEIKSGFACGVRVHYADTTAPADAHSLPLVEGPSGTTEGHLMVVRGFETDEDGTEYVLCNDSYAKSDADAERRYRLDQFDRAWDGVAYLLHGKDGARACASPERVTGELRKTQFSGQYALYLHGERHSLPTDFCERDGLCTGTVCYTVQDGHAYATTAHKHFYYTDVTPTGNILLDTAIPAGTRITVYLIGELGHMIVADLTV